jgi:dinuclear metal center YbgI/SA1388 family protein
VAAEAIRERADLVVTHHPLPFKPLKRLTTDEPTGRLLLDLIKAGVAVHSPHTAFDSAAAGINQQLAEGLGLTKIQPLEECANSPSANVGTGRYGSLARPSSLNKVAERVKTFLRLPGVQAVGLPEKPITRVAVACGSAGEFLEAAISRGCEVLVTGETRLHTCYEAEARGIALLLPGHYASERFGIERLAEVLAGRFSDLTIWASRDESDPLCWV